MIIEKNNNYKEIIEDINLILGRKCHIVVVVLVYKGRNLGTGSDRKSLKPKL